MMPRSTIEMTDQDQVDQRREKFENAVILLSLGITGVATVIDIMTDISAGASKFHLIDEAFITILTFVGFVFIWRRTLSLHRAMQMQKSKLTQIQKGKEQAESESLRWRQEAAKVLQGLSNAIDSQLTRWHLTAAEKEVALLLLKGLSLKEVAEVRGVSEKTARAQSFSVYSKSGLGGRAELSAFFLEDLLTPVEPQTST